MKCNLCYGPAELQGSLGSAKQYRCRNCGMWFTRYAKSAWSIASQSSVRAAQRTLSQQRKTA